MLCVIVLFTGRQEAAIIYDEEEVFMSITAATVNRMTTCLENLEMSGNLTAVREMSGILLKVRELSGKGSCQGKVA